MTCACLPSIRGLFPALRLTGSRATPTGSSSKNIQGTSTNISSQHRPNTTYIKMNDLHQQSDADSVERLVEGKDQYETADGIKVKTEISVIRDRV